MEDIWSRAREFKYTHFIPRLLNSNIKIETINLDSNLDICIFIN